MHFAYSRLSNSRGEGNKQRGGAKVPELLIKWEGGNNWGLRDLSPNLLHKMKEEDGKI